MASHRSAAHLWGLAGFPPPGRIEVTVPRHRRPRSRGGVMVHESRAFDLVGGTRRWGVPVTSAPRVIVDLAASADDDLTVLRALDEVRRLHLATWTELWECVLLHAARGRPGVQRCRRILSLRDGKTVPDSEFARLFVLLLARAGLPEPVSEHRIGSQGRPAGSMRPTRIGTSRSSSTAGATSPRRPTRATGAATTDWGSPGGRCCASGGAGSRRDPTRWSPRWQRRSRPSET